MMGLDNGSLSQDERIAETCSRQWTTSPHGRTKSNELERWEYLKPGKNKPNRWTAPRIRGACKVNLRFELDRFGSFMRVGGRERQGELRGLVGTEDEIDQRGYEGKEAINARNSMLMNKAR